MSAKADTVPGMKRPMKTFDAERDIFHLLEKASALLTAAYGRNFGEGRLIRQVLLEHAANDALRDGPKLLEAHLAALTPAQREKNEAGIRENYETRRKELLATCRNHKIKVSEEYRFKRSPTEEAP